MSEGPVHHEVVIAGFGGQGVVLAGRLLATAALNEEREVVWAPSYGPEMRGGAVHCTVIISSQRIGSPEVSLADCLLIMDRASLPLFAQRVKPGGLFVLNSSLIPERPSENECRVLMIPANVAAEELGNLRVANVIMLGALLSQRPVVQAASLEEAIREEGLQLLGDRAEALIAVNLRALRRGMELGREAA
jgi:2-oxoglutarate ferredoxin oxidoreductase subunit gamma